MATLTAQTVTVAGITETLVAATAGGDAMTPGKRNYLKVNNAGAGSITVTIPAQQPCSYGSGSPTHDIVATVGAGVTKLIGPVDAAIYARAADGLATITYSAVTSVTVGAFSLGL